MPQSPQIPQVPVVSYFDPNKVDRGLVEYYSTETAAYVALDLGTPHPDTRNYPGFRLGLQQAVPLNPGWVRRVYVTDETNPDWFNAQEKFSAESDAHPIFIRSYREDKKIYAPRTKLAPLDTVVKLVRDSAGSGYTPGTFPSLTFVGGGGSGAVGHAVVAADGTIAELVLDDGGSGYRSVTGSAPLVLRAEANAYIEKNVSALTDVWLSFDLFFHADALAFWKSNGPFTTSGDFADLESNTPAVELLGLYILGISGVANWDDDANFSSLGSPSPTPAPMAETWQHCELHYSFGAGIAQLYVNGVLAWTDTGPIPPDTVAKLRLGNYQAVADASSVAFIRNVKAGTTRSGGDIFADDFTSGNLSAWDNQTGTVGLVSDPGWIALALTIDPPPSGTTATGAAFIQPQTALLVAEEAKEFPGDSEFFGLFFDVTRVYETLPGPILTTKTVGQDNLTPAKYRRLIRTEATDQPVPANYTFPAGLSGDQTQIRLQQETVAKARLQIISEIIAITGDALIGGELDEFGELKIYETVVNEGTHIDQGFLVLKSSVTPFGNGKAVKITVNYPANLAAIRLLDHSLGNPNLTPAKYRRLVRQDTTRQKVDPSSYIFPPFLSGNQTELQYIQETITRARLQTLEEIIATTGDALIGGEGDEYGVLRIEETVVNEGTPIDQGFLIKHSSVTPFGNGKAVKITVIYTNAVIAAVKVTAGGSGGSNGTHTDGSFTGGGGSGATFTYIVSGGIVLDSIVITNPGSGYTGVPVAVLPSAGAGKTTVVYLAGPLLTSRLYDPEMQVHYDESRQIVMIGTPDSPDVTFVSEETRALDVWRSVRTRTKKIPDATDEASAKISYAFRPYKFPGTLDFIPAIVSDGWLGYRSAKADLVQTTVRTWWETGTSPPTVAFDEIISDTVVVRGAARLERFTDVLHNGFSTSYASAFGATLQNYPPTTPNFSEYYQGTPSGSSTSHVSISLFDPGAGGYVVGDHLFFASGTAEIVITAVQAGGFIYSWSIVDEGLGGTYSNPVTATGGSGSGAKFNLFEYTTADFTPGTAWVGTERVVSASVTPEKEKNLWKVVTETVVMR